MFVAFYRGTSKGWPGLIDVAIRKVLHGDYSHCELVFEPGDRVDELMPDKTCALSPVGAYWCASSSMMDRMPEWSKRTGKLGGVRFKRLTLSDKNWVRIQLPDTFDAAAAAKWFKDHEGLPYAIKGTIAHALPFLRYTPGTYNCTQATADALFFDEAYRFNPSNLDIVLDRISKLNLFAKPNN